MISFDYRKKRENSISFESLKYLRQRSTAEQNEELSLTICDIFLFVIWCNKSCASCLIGVIFCVWQLHVVELFMLLCQLSALAYAEFLWLNRSVGDYVKIPVCVSESWTTRSPKSRWWTGLFLFLFPLDRQNQLFPAATVVLKCLWHETKTGRCQNFSVIGIHFGYLSVCEIKRLKIIFLREVFKALLFFLFDRKCFPFWILWKVSFWLTESHTTVKCLKLEYYTLMWSLQERRKLMVSLSHVFVFEWKDWEKPPKIC